MLCACASPSLLPVPQSFSTVGALEAAWFRETGKQQLFSEQHMVDCSWEGGNKGCYGALLLSASLAPARLRLSWLCCTATATLGAV